MKLLLRKRFVNLLFIVALVVLLFTSFLVYQQIQHLLNANERVVHTHEVLEKINTLLLDVIDDDRLEAAYMDSNDPKYLEKFEKTLQQTPEKFAEMRTVMSDNPSQQQRLNTLEPLIAKRVLTAQGVIQTFKTAGRAAATQQRLAEHDQDLIDTIKRQAEDISNAEVALLQQRNARAIYDSHRSSLLVIVVSGISDFLLLLSFVLLSYHLTERQNAEEKKLDAESALAGIIENTNDLIAAIDTDMCFTAFNKPYEEKFMQMFNRKIAIGMSFYDAISSSPNREEVLLHWQRALAGEEFTISQEWGKDIFYEITFNPIKKNNRCIGASKIMRNVTQRHLEEIILKEANQKLNHGLMELKNRYHAMALLNEMSEVLQSCMTTEEAYLPIKTYCQQVLPYSGGVLYVMHPSQTYLEIVTEWGISSNKERVFAPDQCWALRRNQIHKVDNPDNNIVCGHILAVGAEATPYICIPLMAHNETLGLLFLEGPTQEDNSQENSRVRNEHQRLLLITAEKQISLALANIKLRETLRHLSIRDPLTGLYNRRYLEETLDREFHRAERKKLSLAVVMIDIDHFKRFNDTYGHDAGDYILKYIGKILQEEARGSDIVCRYGGEEFLVFMYDTDLTAAKVYAERLRDSLRQLSLQYGAIKLGGITISQGIAIFPTDGVMPQTLIECADHALYRAKKLGRDRIVFAHDET